MIFLIFSGSIEILTGDIFWDWKENISPKTVNIRVGLVIRQILKKIYLKTTSVFAKKA